MPDQPTPPDQRYTSPLATRNASAAMQAIWSPHTKFTTWRRLWLALAEAQHELGLDIKPSSLRSCALIWRTSITRPRGRMKEARHDVMAHVHALGDVAPTARPIIHLGATSQFVNCNTELIQIREALQLVAPSWRRRSIGSARFAETYKATPTLGFTHYQPAQPTTVGKRAALWAHDLALALEEIEHRLSALRFRGVKGTTGTQASFLALFENAGCSRDEAHEKVEQLDRRVTEKMGWSADRRFAITGQTYPRVVDGMVTASLAAVAAQCAEVCDGCATACQSQGDRGAVREGADRFDAQWRTSATRCAASGSAVCRGLSSA